MNIIDRIVRLTYVIIFGSVSAISCLFVLYLNPQINTHDKLCVQFILFGSILIEGQAIVLFMLATMGHKLIEKYGHKNG